MKRLLIAFGLTMVAVAPAARAQSPGPIGCSVIASTSLPPQGTGDVTIGCTGINEAAGRQLADMLNRILQNRLDPQTVMTKLNEVASVPEKGVGRVLSEDQRQGIIKHLLGKPTAQIAVAAHPLVEDSAEFAQALAMSLLTVGWQIENGQIRRRATKELDPVAGVALVVRDHNSLPQKAQQLKDAFAAANIGAALVSDPALAPDAIVLWIGRRPEFAPK